MAYSNVNMLALPVARSKRTKGLTTAEEFAEKLGNPGLDPFNAFLLPLALSPVGLGGAFGVGSGRVRNDIAHTPVGLGGVSGDFGVGGGRGRSSIGPVESGTLFPVIGI